MDDRSADGVKEYHVVRHTPIGILSALVRQKFVGALEGVRD
jgi:hypothetical protein